MDFNVQLNSNKMTELEKEEALCKYLEEWIKIRYQKWCEFYAQVDMNRKNGIYHLKYGPRLMDLMNIIDGNLHEYFCLPDETSHLIPNKFASIAHLINSLENFKNIVIKYKPIIESNIEGPIIENYILSGLLKVITDIEEMANRCTHIYRDEIPRPYQILREQLFNKDLDGFKESVNGILKGVPYLSRKKKFEEGHFQTMIQILLFVLGFKPISEQITSDGRIDMVLELTPLIYIFEFKYTTGQKSQAKRALKQIEDKGYAEPYKLTSREIIGVGISFSEISRCINGLEKKTIFKV